jgi:putative nucleotidyltransferase with HDIG domain
MLNKKEVGTVADKITILAVDDTPESLKLLTDILREEGYAVRSAINGALALSAAINHPPELVVLDVRMPEMDGFEVCRRLKAHPATREVPVIFVTALSETEEKVRGFALGAVDFVTKPYQREELLARVRTHLEIEHLRNHLEALVDLRTRALQESERRLRANLLDFVSAIAATIEMRDPYTAGHQQRVAGLSSAIAIELQLPQEQIEGLNLACLVHDIGKIRVPAEILARPGPLSDAEFNFLRQHPANGYEILKSIDFPWPVANTVLQHHERLDGSGYPLGLKGGDILLEARILAVADVVEAMVSHRPYRSGLGIAAALEEIERHRGIRYEPIVVDACLNLFREHRYTLN